jgi:hypothetical protein
MKGPDFQFRSTDFLVASVASLLALTITLGFGG